MATPVTVGSVKEVNFARISAPSTKWSFLEEGLGAIKGAQFSRTTRLGDPVNLGPHSNWQQLSWIGGGGQDVWSDREMYQSGTADTQSQTGKIRMWPGWASLMKWDAYGLASRLLMCQGSGSITGYDWSHSALFIAQSDGGPWEARDPSYWLWRIDPTTGVGTPPIIQFVTGSGTPFRAMAAMQSDDQVSNWVALTNAGDFFLVQESSLTVVKDTNADAAGEGEYSWDSLVSFSDGMYYCRGNALMKRVPAPPFGVLGTHTIIKKVRPADHLRSLVVWNNRLWFGANYANGQSAVYVSDGATSTKAFDFPHEFYTFKMVAHAGSLYILGFRVGSVDRTKYTQQVWRYDGSTLKKLWEEGSFEDGIHHGPGDIAANGDNVVWSQSGWAGGGGRARLMYYDTINDAIIDGPGIDTHVAATDTFHIEGILNWNNTLVAFFKDWSDYRSVSPNAWRPAMVAYLRASGLVRNYLPWPYDGLAAFTPGNDVAEVVQHVTSSEYHGDDSVAAEQKTWLNVRVLAKLTGTYSRLRVKAIINGTTYTLGTQTFGGGDGVWKTYTFPVKDGSGNYLKSESIQYRVELINYSQFNSADTDVVFVDTISTQWIVAPTKRRQWNLRIPVTDAQLKLDGSANSLVTAAALAQKLEDLYFENLPILMWGPNTDGSSAGVGTEVFITDFSRQEARTASDEAGTVGYVTLTLVENVIS